MFRMFVYLVVGCLLSLIRLTAGTADDNVDFARDIQPILKAHCHACHGADEQEGQLRLDAKVTTFKGGVNGPPVIKGNAKGSPLYRRIVGVGDEDRMPLDEKPLSDEQIALIRRWIDQGAAWPDGVGANVNLDKHWAYVKPVRSPLPKVANSSWPQSPIDYFILARLEHEKLAPSPAADRARLLRRVYLDLIGLPPSVEDVDAFLADDSPSAYEKVVDRLLTSPQYGVRWARPWLDLARYADSNGYQADQYRNVWPYRDWVINAMNADMPFDQFALEQLAGDLLPNATIDQKIATGFSRLTTCNVEAGVDPEENRVNQVIDRVNTTGTVWLGTTIECTQCHNHKYDPFSQKEFYQLFAYFNNTPLEVEGNGVTYNFVGPKMDLPLTDEQVARRDAIEQQIESSREILLEMNSERAKLQPEWEKQIAAAQSQAPQWHVLEVDSFHSQGGANHEILDDHSVLVSGARPDKESYTITVTTKLNGITGFKLETLTHESLPGNGPGRHDAKQPNFVLNEFTVTASDPSAEASGKPTGSSSRPVELHSAEADFSQGRFAVAGAIDGKPDTAWAINPRFGKPHWATFLTREPVGSQDGSKFTFTLDQHHGGCRAIGRLRLSAMTGQPGKNVLPKDISKILAIKQEKRTLTQQQKLDLHFLDLDPQIIKQRKKIDQLRTKLKAVQPITTLVMVEQDKPRENNVFKRGVFLDRGKPVSAGTPRTLHRQPKDLPSNRLGLARWITDPANPLTPRVSVNRWWAEIFGEGIVATVEDFGTQGELPTHPELLDWLASEFVDSGWSMKHIHKTIVMSSTYRQSSHVSRALAQRDPQNYLYARGPRFRLAAETIRDNALAITGLFSAKMAGPPIYPPQPDGHWRHVGRNAPKYNTSQGNDRFRRGVYVVWRRSAPYPSFTNFDAPDRASCVVKRPRTNTPVQALTLLNDPAYIEMALSLARRIAADHSNFTISEKAAYGFRLCVSRMPKPAEAKHLKEVYLRELALFEADPKAAQQLVGKAAGGDVDAKELAAWFYVSNILLNLDETITKG